MHNETVELNESSIKKLSAMATAAQAIQTHCATSHLILPEGYKHVDITAAIEKAQEFSNRKHGTVQISDLDSFLQYASDQQQSGTGYIYADPEKRTLTAIFNDYGHVEQHGWRDFRAVYTAELSREFGTWLGNNKKQMEQEDFAIFLEDNIADVCEPSGEVLLAIALTLQAKTEVNFSSSKRLDNGQVQFSYTENVDARAGVGLIEIPREFKIGLRLFKNGEGYKVRARLKYRLNGGKLKFWYELDRPENAIEDAFKAYIDKARESSYRVLLGKA